MKTVTINGMELRPMDVWIEKASGYGHYKLCLMMDDGDISSTTFADSHIWDSYGDIEDAEVAFDFIINHFENRLADMIPTV